MSTYTLSIWDLETLHESTKELEYGPSWHRRFRFGAHPPVVNIPALASYIEEHNAVNWHDALADWQHFDHYADQIANPRIQPVQVFSRSRSWKDRLASYADSLFERGPMAQAVGQLILLGASDRMESIAKRAHEHDMKVTAIGLPSMVGSRLRQYCDDILDYREYVAHSTSRAIPDTVRQSLAATMNDIEERTGREWISRVRIKPALLRHSPSFNEKDYGFLNFSSFLRAVDDVLFCRQSDSQREPEYALRPKLRSTSRHNLSDAELDRREKVNLYNRIATQEGLKLPAAEIMWEGIDIYVAFINDPVGFKDFGELDDECFLQLRKAIPSVQMTDAKRVRQVLFKCFLFTPNSGDQIGFRSDVTTLEQVEDLYFDLITERVADKTPPPIDFAALSVMATGSPDQSGRLEARYDAKQLAEPER